MKFLKLDEEAKKKKQIERIEEIVHRERKKKERKKQRCNFGENGKIARNYILNRAYSLVLEQQ
jgi:hypothetical protein